MCCYGCVLRSLYEMYKMVLPLSAALSQMNPINTSSPISLRSVLMFLYHKFQVHPMSTVPCDLKKKKYAFVVLIVACRISRLCYPSGFYHSSNACGKSTICDISYYVNLFLFLLGLLPLSLVKILLQNFFGITCNLFFLFFLCISRKKTRKSVYFMYLVFISGR